jgi:O-antigen ligase
MPFHYTYPKFFLCQTLLVFWAIFVLFDVFSEGNVQIKPAPKAVSIWLFPFFLLCYAVWNTIAIRWAVWPYGARQQVLRELTFFCLALASFVSFGSPKRWKQFAIVFVWAAGFAALLQFSRILIGFFSSGGGKSLTAIYRTRPFLFANKNYGCALFITGALVATGMMMNCFFGEAKGKDKPFLKVSARKVAALCVGIVLFFSMLVVSNSLAGFVAAGIAVPAYAICLMPRRWRRVCVTGIVLVFVAVVLISFANEKLTGRLVSAVYERETTAKARAVWWLAAADMMESEVVHGLGPAGYAAAYYTYAPPIARRSQVTRGLMATHPHNELLRIGAELGIVGLVFYALVIVVPFIVSYRALVGSERSTGFVGFALWAGALAFLVQSLFSKAIAFWDFALPYWMLMGLLASAGLWSSPHASSRRIRIIPRHLKKRTRWFVFVPVVGVVLWGWLSWAYLPYRSMVALTSFSDGARVMAMRFENQSIVQSGERYVEKLNDLLEVAKKGCLWPTEILRQRFVFGDLLVKCGFYREGIRHLEWVNDSAPGMLDVRKILGRSYMALGENARARSYLIRYLESSPEDTGAYVELAELDEVTAARMLQTQVTTRDQFSFPPRVALLGCMLARLGYWDGLYALIEDVGGHGERKSLDLLARHVTRYCKKTGEDDRLRDLAGKFPGLFESDE